MTLQKLLLIYLAVMNILGFALMGTDKSRARNGKWRIRERTLFLFSLLGGSIGTLTGMYVFRHKTKHWYFQYGMPAILLIQVVLCVFLVKLLLPT